MVEMVEERCTCSFKKWRGLALRFQPPADVALLLYFGQKQMYCWLPCFGLEVKWYPTEANISECRQMSKVLIRTWYNVVV